MSEPVPGPGRRSMCERCRRPQSACICRWIAPVASQFEVPILQHPLEVANPKGSARLLHLSLPNSRLAQGETFAGAALRELLYAPWTGAEAGAGAAAGIGAGTTADTSAVPAHAVLLYPELPGGIVGHDGDANGYDANNDNANNGNAVAPGAGLPGDPARLRLVVLDATWRKSRKMLYLNPLLQTLPRFSLTDVPASRYLIRKAHLPHQLSTLEAACLALMRLERDATKFAPLLDAFDGFIEQQRGYRPR